MIADVLCHMPSMTNAAREVLRDCRIALELLEEEVDLRRWRVHWAGALALTRAIGHVLEKVDGQEPHVRAIAREAYTRWRAANSEHEIFREFIERERNQILKEYRFNHHPSEEVDVAILATMKNLETGEIMRTAEVIPIADNIYRPLIEGYREGDDARDVLSEALDWWEHQLDAIDLEVARRKSDA